MRTEVQLDGSEIVIRLRTDATPSDSLIAIAKEPLAELGLELKAVRKLIADGALRTVAIGRRTFTKTSYLTALVDSLPAAKAVGATDDLAIAAQKRAARRSK